MLALHIRVPSSILTWLSPKSITGSDPKYQPGCSSWALSDAPQSQFFWSLQKKRKKIHFTRDSVVFPGRGAALDKSHSPQPWGFTGIFREWGLVHLWLLCPDKLGQILRTEFMQKVSRCFFCVVTGMGAVRKSNYKCGCVLFLTNSVFGQENIASISCLSNEDTDVHSTKLLWKSKGFTGLKWYL